MASFLTSKQVDRLLEAFKQLPFTNQFQRDAREAERKYLVEERIGILCGKDEPSPAQRELAESESNQWLDSQVNSR